MKTTIYADFNNADPHGRLRLNCQGTIDDLRAKNVELEEGLFVMLSDGELQVMGKVMFSDEEGIWVASIDWKRILPVDG